MFGDNLVCRGLGGQAKEMRGEPNAVGYPTKRRPSMTSSAFFDDGDFTLFTSSVIPTLRRLEKHLEAGGTVVFPQTASENRSRRSRATRSPDLGILAESDCEDWRR